MKRDPKPKKMFVPRFGVLRDGEHDGWRYAVLHLVLNDDESVTVHLRVTRPNWPFPKEIDLPLADGFRLQPVPGDSAPWLNVTAAVEQARAAEAASA